MPPELIFHAVTTERKSRRHWSESPVSRYVGYATLCSGHRAMDQAQLVDSMPKRWRNRTVITDLPPCRKCDKSRQRREADRREA